MQTPTTTVLTPVSGRNTPWYEIVLAQKHQIRKKDVQKMESGRWYSCLSLTGVPLCTEQLQVLYARVEMEEIHSARSSVKTPGSQKYKTLP